MEAVSDILKNAVSAFTLGGGASLTGTVTLNFGSPGRRSVLQTFTVTGAATSQRIIASVSLNMPAGVSVDELEMDGIAVAAYVSAANTVIVAAHTTGGPISGNRNVNLFFYTP